MNIGRIFSFFVLLFIFGYSDGLCFSGVDISGFKLGMSYDSACDIMKRKGIFDTKNLSPYKFERIYGYDDQTKYYNVDDGNGFERKIIYINCDDNNGFRLYFVNNVLVFYTKFFNSIPYKDVFEKIDKSYKDCTVIMSRYVPRDGTTKFDDDFIPKKVWVGKLQDMPKSFEDFLFNENGIFEISIVSKGEKYDLQCSISSNVNVARVSYIYKGYKEIIALEEKVMEEKIKKEKSKKDALLDGI